MLTCPNCQQPSAPSDLRCTTCGTSFLGEVAAAIAEYAPVPEQRSAHIVAVPVAEVAATAAEPAVAGTEADGTATDPTAVSPPSEDQLRCDDAGRWWIWTATGWQLYADPASAAVAEVAAEPGEEWQRDTEGCWWRWTGTQWQQWDSAAGAVVALAPQPSEAAQPDPGHDPQAAAAAEEFGRRGDTITTEEPRRMRLGDILVESGIIDADTLRKALSDQYGMGGARRRLGEVLLGMGAVTEEQLMLALSQRLGVDYVDLDSKSIDASLLEVITPEYCSRLQLVPFDVDEVDRSVSVALADPTQVVAIDDLTLLTGRRLVPHAALPSAVERALGRIRGGDLAAMSSAEDAEVRTVRLIDTLLGEAVRVKASDLHIEPVGSKVLVRARIDGRLRAIFRADVESLPRLVSRLKILSDLDIAEKRRPQDGRAHFEVFDRRVDARVSTLPSVRGEKVVMRLIDRDESAPSLADLGMRESSFALFRDAIAETQGLVLITGPTGSGKTTTLYSALSAVLEPEVNVITLEDPVERELLGSTQVHIEDKRGLTFPAALRSVLRQDPDVIMVGEVRDLETAEITLRAALSGHLVFSTVHTNDTCSTVTRLIEMGIEPYLVGSALSLVVAQRLVRRVCESCAAPAAAPEEEARRLRVRLPDGGYWRRGAGCPTCSDTGYKGRMGVYEVLRVDDSIEELLVPGVTAAEVFKVARSGGLVSMWDEGLRLAAEGLTTLDEIGRVVSGARIPPELAR